MGSYFVCMGIFWVPPTGNSIVKRQIWFLPSRSSSLGGTRHRRETQLFRDCNAGKMVRVTVWKTENTGTVHITLPEELGICSWAAVMRGDGKGDPAL